MLWVPKSEATRIVTNLDDDNCPGFNTSITTIAKGTIVAPGSRTFGSVVEIISAANNVRDSWGIEIWIGYATASTGAITDSLARILVGGATDDILIDNLIYGYSHSIANQAGHRYFFPLHIPAGLRIAAQTSCNSTTNTSAHIMVWLYGGGVPPFRVGRKVVTYGTPGSFNCRGQDLTTAASGGAAGVTQMTASTGQDHFAFIPGWQPQNDSSITPNGYINVGIGVGASTEERIGTWWFNKDTNEAASGPFPSIPAFRNVPAGSRLTMLCSNSGTNDTAAYGGLIYAV